jgi:hypothetical protein
VTVAPATPGLIDRGDLLAVLDRAAASKVTVISAPAGSGKTSLLRAWAGRGGANLSMLIGTAGLFGIFLFLTYYLQQTLGYSPLVTGVVFLPMSAGLIVAANLSTITLMPRFGPKPLVAFGMLSASGGTAWLAQLGSHTGYAAGVLGPMILAGVGLGMIIAPAINTGTFGVAPQDAGVASATVTVGQMLGGSGRYVAPEHHLRQRRRLIHHRASRRGPAHRPPGTDRAGAGARLRHRVLVDRRHLRCRRGRGRCPAPPRAAEPDAHAIPGTWRGDNGTSRSEPGAVPVTGDSSRAGSLGTASRLAGTVAHVRSGRTDVDVRL